MNVFVCSSYPHRAEAELAGGQVSSDGGGVLLRDADRRIDLPGVIWPVAFTDGRSIGWSRPCGGWL
jgi:hypothetical protein